MTEYFLDKGAKNFVIMSGGASSGNRLHQVRTWGMLNTLEEKAGLVLTEEAETLSTTEEVTKLSSEEIKLPEAVKLYTEGVNLVKQCKDSLDKVEKELIVLEENGEEHEL